MKRNFLILILSLTLALGLAIPIAATESESWADEVLSTIESHTNGTVSVVYTADSVTPTGVSWEFEIDILSQQTYLVIRPELSAGYVIFDDPATQYIDGIRVNGQTVDSYKVPIDYTQDVDYEIVVKTGYDEGFVGSLAQISDGTFDWMSLLENPVGLLIAAYYVLATIFVVVGIVSAVRGKNKKVKSADDIAKQVQTTSETAAMGILEGKVLPVVTAIQETSQALVKAFALTTSKSKEAPTALLDILQKVSNTDTAAAIEEAKKVIAEDRAKAEAQLQHTKDVLNDIAHTVQEVSNNGTTQLEQTPEKEDVAIF